MGTSYEYETTIDELITDLNKLRKIHGGDMTVQLPDPGHYDPHFEGRNSKLTVKFDEHHLYPDWSRVIIVQEDLK